MSEDVERDPHEVVVKFPRRAFKTSKQAAVEVHRLLTEAGHTGFGITAEEKETQP